MAWLLLLLLLLLLLRWTDSEGSGRTRCNSRHPSAALPLPPLTGQ